MERPAARPYIRGVDRFFDRLGDLLRDVLAGTTGSSGGRVNSGTPGSGRRPRGFDDPDLAAAWDELEEFLNADDEGREGAAAGGGPSAGTGAAAGPAEQLRADYATLEVAFGAPLPEVRRAYKRLMRAHHPDRFATEPARQVAATRTAARINDAYARIDRASRR